MLMSVFGTRYRGEEMCKNCGSCGKEHLPTIDDSIDKVEESVLFKKEKDTSNGCL
jgi:hypothetical protein